MAGGITRLVDPHVPLWDPARTDWYPHLSSPSRLGLGDASKVARRFDEPTYFTESKRWNVVKYVHVAAVVPAVLTQETAELQAHAERTGHPDAIIGGIDPLLPIDRIAAQLDVQSAAGRFRGVRPLGLIDGAVPDREVLAQLRDRGLILELMAHTEDLRNCAEVLAEWGELTVVLEHTGWPRSGAPEEFAEWQRGMAALAGVGGHVVCKLSGLAMPLGSIDVATFRPWISHAIECFGVDRCLFGSNFPVDGGHGSFDELYDTYDALTADLDAVSRDKLFAANAERVYRC